jgi:hypothetical protein
MLSGLTLAACAYPYSIPFVLGDPFEAIWKAAAVAAVALGVLGVQTLVMTRFGRGAGARRLTIEAGVACAVTTVVAVVASRFAARGLVCAGAAALSPLPPDVATLAARTQQDNIALYVLGTLTILSWAAAFTVAVLGIFGSLDWWARPRGAHAQPQAPDVGTGN